MRFSDRALLGAGIVDEIQALAEPAGWFPVHESALPIQIRRWTAMEKSSDPRIDTLATALNHTFSAQSRKLLEAFLDKKPWFVHTEDMRRHVWHGIKVYELAIMDGYLQQYAFGIAANDRFRELQEDLLARPKRKNFFPLWAQSLPAPYFIPAEFSTQRFAFFLLSLLAHDKAERVITRMTRPLLDKTLIHYPDLRPEQNPTKKPVIKSSLKIWPLSDHFMILSRFVIRQIGHWAIPFMPNSTDLTAFFRAFNISEKKGILEWFHKGVYAFWGDLVLDRYWADQMMAQTDSSVRAKTLRHMRDDLNNNHTFGYLSREIVRQGTMAIKPAHGGSFLESAASLIYWVNGGIQGDGMMMLEKALASIIHPQLWKIKLAMSRKSYLFLKQWNQNFPNPTHHLSDETRQKLISLRRIQHSAIKVGVLGSRDTGMDIVEKLVLASNHEIADLPEVWRNRLEPRLVQTLAVIAARWNGEILSKIVGPADSEPAAWMHDFFDELLDYYHNPDSLGPWLLTQVQRNAQWVQGPFWVSVALKLSEESVQELGSWLVHHRGRTVEGRSPYDAQTYDVLLKSLLIYPINGAARIKKVLNHYGHRRHSRSPRVHEPWIQNLLLATAS